MSDSFFSQESETTRSSLELLYNISRELSTALDLPTVLQRILFSSMRTIGANSGSIIVMDDGGNPIDAAIIHGAKVLDHKANQLRITLDEGLAGWVLRNRKAVLVPDTQHDERWLLRPDDAETATGAKSAVSAPLIAREKIVGVMTLVQPKVNFFSLEHLSLVQAIAEQAGVTVLNARLYAESQRRERVMTALAYSAQAITATLKVDDVLKEIMHQISEALRVDIVSLGLIDADSSTFEFIATTLEEGITMDKIQYDTGITGWVIANDEGAIVQDAYSDARFDRAFDQPHDVRTNSIACVPLRTDGNVIGAVQAINPESGSFSPDDLQVLMGIGSLAGTAIRHAQLFEEIDSAHQRYRDLFNDSIDLVLITDLEGSIIEANQQTATLTGHAKQTLQDMMIFNLHKSDSGDTVAQLRILEDGKSHSYESMLVTKSSSEIPIQVHAHQINIGADTYLQWIFRDITERKNLDELRDDLISMVYHDLRSPLSNIISSMDVLDSMLSTQEDPTVDLLISIAIRSTDRIQRLTSSLLDINRLEAGQAITNAEAVNTRNLIEEAIEVVIPMTENKTQSLDVSMPEDVPEIQIDRDMIKRVLINLLENASKYSEVNGDIAVIAEEKDDYVTIMIQDSGLGIPDEDKNRIFDKYIRLNERRGSKGIGLGLAFCKLAIDAHLGRIWIEDAPSGGASFNIELPISNHQNENQEDTREQNKQD